MHAIARAAYLASVDLAKEKGAFPLFDARVPRLGQHAADGHRRPRGDRASRHPQRASDLGCADGDDLAVCRQRQLGDRAGLRLCLHPQGPAEGRLAHRGGSRRLRRPPLARKAWRRALPDHFVNAQTLPPLDHVRMQAAAQKWVDSSISKTINCPEDISFDASRRSTWPPGTRAAKAARPTGRTT
jgi:ribonucleoside-diphosphate reductase alpha chain